MPYYRGNWVPVVTGLITKGDKVLVGQRPNGGNLAGYWEFPGGKIEVGENPEACLLYTSPSPRDATLSRMPSSA